jgi:hypothetical protein
MPKTKRQKMDKAIVIALIGLVGTVVAALLASPIIKVLFEKSPTPEAGSTLNDGKRLIFENDFENGQVSGFAFSSNEWQVTKDKGNQVLEMSGTGTGNGSAVFGPNDFSDGIIEFQINFKNFNGFILTFRGFNSQTYTLYLAPTGGEITLGYGSAANNWDLELFESNSTRLFEFTEGVWYDVKLEAVGEKMTVWVDNNRILSSQDSRLQKGELEFSVQYDGTVLLDNVKVFEYVR